MFRLFVTAFALLVPSLLWAQDSSHTACESSKAPTEMRGCISRGLQAAERDLQRYLAEARRRAANRALVDSVQIAWRRYRDLACRAAGGAHNRGTSQPVAVLSCLLDLTRRRIHDVYEHYLRTNDTALPEPEP
jgi:uncharacterized protein YecT (DUF1311 family)